MIKPVFKVIHTNRAKIVNDSNTCFYRAEDHSHDSYVPGSLTANYEAASSSRHHE